MFALKSDIKLKNYIDNSECIFIEITATNTYSKAVFLNTSIYDGAFL